MQSSYELGELGNAPDNVIISNAQKFNPHPQPTTWRDLPDDMFSVVMVDEAHHLPSKQWEQIVTKFRQHTTKVIFFTATPKRADGKQITTDGAIQSVGFAYQLSREKAIEEGIIRDAEFMSIPLVHYETYQPTSVDKRMKYARDVVHEVVQLLKSKDESNPLPEGKKHAALVITKDMSKATMVKEMAQREHPDIADSIAEVHTNVHKILRKIILDKLSKGNVRIIIIVSMLREGFDYPPISVAGIVTRIHSCVKFAQFIGRAQRVVRSETGAVEEGVKAHIVTHDYFQQRDLFDEYIKPCIPLDEGDPHFTTLDTEND